MNTPTLDNQLQTPLNQLRKEFIKMYPKHTTTWQTMNFNDLLNRVRQEYWEFRQVHIRAKDGLNENIVNYGKLYGQCLKMHEELLDLALTALMCVDRMNGFIKRLEQVIPE